MKWLGQEAPGTLAVDGKGSKAELIQKVTRWVAASGRTVTQPGSRSSDLIILTFLTFVADLVMIVSYETLRTLSEYLVNCNIGLLLCDEGHRLKNSGMFDQTLPQ